jgi:hypothetical protein
MSKAPKPKIQQELFNIRQCQEYLGCNLGHEKISELMEEGYLPAIMLGGKMTKVTTRQHLENFVKRLFAEPMQNKIIESAPVRFIKKY